MCFLIFGEENQRIWRVWYDDGHRTPPSLILTSLLPRPPDRFSPSSSFILFHFHFHFHFPSSYIHQIMQHHNPSLYMPIPFPSSLALRPLPYPLLLILRVFARAPSLFQVWEVDPTSQHYLTPRGASLVDVPILCGGRDC